MRIPKSFRLKGRHWTVKYRPDPADDGDVECMGCCDTGERTIYLSPDLRGQDLIDTFHHELFHAVIFESHLGSTSLASDLEEILCDAFADVLSTNFSRMRWKTTK